MADRKQPQMVLVRWIDSCSQPGWRGSLEPAPEVAMIETCGFLMGRDKTQIRVALSYGVKEEMQPWADIVTIPLSAVQSVRRLKL